MVRPTDSRWRSRQRSAAHPPGRTLLRLLLPLLLLAALGLGLVRTARVPKADTVASQRQLAEDNAQTLLVALQRLAADCGRPPTEQEGLVSLIHNPGLTDWQGPYIFELKPDPWGRPFRYSPQPDDTICIGSDGPDALPSTDDDLWCTAPKVQISQTNRNAYGVRIFPGSGRRPGERHRP